MAYVYRHIRVDKDQPFYIGIGSGEYYKRARVSKSRNRIWTAIASRTNWFFEILFDNVEVEFAKKKEIEFISLYGRIIDGGILANLTSGGDMNSEDAIRLVGVKNKGRVPANKGVKNPTLAENQTGQKHFSYKGIVYCFDLNGNPVSSHITIGAAARFAGIRINDVRRVIVGERNQYKGHIYSYSPERPSPIKVVQRKPKMVIDTATGEVFNTIMEAARHINMNHKTLSHYLHGTRASKTTLSFMNHEHEK